MKKLFLLSIAVLFAFSMNAQKVGVKAGYGLSGYLINFDAPDGAKMGNGFNAGVVAELDLKVIGVRADVTYIQLGSIVEPADFTSTTDVNYLKISAGIKKGLGPAYLYLGPYFSYALSGNNNYKTDAAETDTDIFDEDIEIVDGGYKGLYNKTDVGVNLGIGASFSGVFVEAYAGLGLTNYLNSDSDMYAFLKAFGGFDKGDEAVESPMQRNLFYGLSVGYMFGK